jgi:hypothetical protein
MRRAILLPLAPFVAFVAGYWLTRAGAWRKLATARARFRAWRLGYAFGPCPVCRREFSCEEIIKLPWPEFVIGSAGDPHTGELVCGKARCQAMARELNRSRYGFVSPVLVTRVPNLRRRS